jgi:5-methylcytosine-specific restriction endonuclease McrA
MDKTTLENYISQGLSTYEIAKAESCGQTNVRHWLRKFGLNTLPRKDQFKIRNPTRNSTNPNSYAKQRERAKIRKSEAVRIKGGKCSICGYCKNYAALEFHHRNPENKTFNLDSRKLSNTNWASILLELEKCDLLCSNCHAETHSPDLELEKLLGAAGIEPALSGLSSQP